jgi:hypothetical protein
LNPGDRIRLTFKESAMSQMADSDHPSREDNVSEFQTTMIIATEALQSAATSTIVRVRGGKLSITDGPFAETKKQLGGFF